MKRLFSIKVMSIFFIAASREVTVDFYPESLLLII